MFEVRKAYSDRVSFSLSRNTSLIQLFIFSPENFSFSIYNVRKAFKIYSFLTEILLSLDICTKVRCGILLVVVLIAKRRTAFSVCFLCLSLAKCIFHSKNGTLILANVIDRRLI